MLIAQKSDGHVQEPGKLAHGRYDTRARFEQALKLIAREHPRPDFLIHTGDLVHQGGSAETYRAVREMLDDTGIPYAVIPGNHDRIDLLRAAFADAGWMPATPGIQYVLDQLPVRVICLDTKIPDRLEGHLGDEGLAWLSARLNEQQTRPTLIAMHHPAFRIGNRSIAAVNFGNEPQFHALLEKHANVRLVIAGHVHCGLQSVIGHAIAITAPSTAFQFAIERRADTGFAILDEPPGYCLHDWTNADGFRSQTVLVGGFEAFAPIR